MHSAHLVMNTKLKVILIKSPPAAGAVLALGSLQGLMTSDEEVILLICSKFRVEICISKTLALYYVVLMLPNTDEGIRIHTLRLRVAAPQAVSSGTLAGQSTCA